MTDTMLLQDPVMVIDSEALAVALSHEFPTLAGDVPCPGMKGMFTRLASRGVNILITYQGHKVLTDVYGEQTAGIIGRLGGLACLAHVQWLDRKLLSPGAGDAQGAQPPLVADPQRLLHGHDRVVWVDAGRQVPQPVVALAPGNGDLLVMGGRTQAEWEHSVPPVGGRATAPRISIQWRHARRVGRPFMGARYDAPLTYGRRPPRR